MSTFIPLSIIIPAFNAAPFIAQCLDSIIRQEMFEEFEVLIVDDGSKDNTKAIIQQYIKMYSNIHLYESHRQFAGGARNIALEHASGQYLLFVDADDYLDGNNLITVLKSAQEEDLDIAVFNYNYLSYKSKKAKLVPCSPRDSRIYSDPRIENKVFSTEEYPNILSTLTYPWNKIFKRKFINDAQIKYSDCFVHNDIFFNMAAFSIAKKIKFFNYVIYIHRYNIEDQLSMKFDERRLEVESIFLECENFFRLHNAPEQLLVCYHIFVVYLYQWMISCAPEWLLHNLTKQVKKYFELLPQEYYLAMIRHESFSPSLYCFAEQFKSVALSDVLGNQDDQLLLSIVVHVHDTRKYLQQCLDSIASQTLDTQHFEVIIIDDQSTDNSSTIYNSYIETNCNFRLLQQPEKNSENYNNTIALGISNAKGKYIGFVDSSSFIGPEMFQQMITVAELRKADLVICSYAVRHPTRAGVGYTPDDKKYNTIFATTFSSRSEVSQKISYCLLNPNIERMISRRSFLVDKVLPCSTRDLLLGSDTFHWYCLTQTKNVFALRPTYSIQREQIYLTANQSHTEKYHELVAIGQSIKAFLLDTGHYPEYRFVFYQWLAVEALRDVSEIPFAKRMDFLNQLKLLASDFEIREIMRFHKTVPCKLSTAVFYFFTLRGFYHLANFARQITEYVVVFYKVIYK